jgi:hypothetical protein
MRKSLFLVSSAILFSFYSFGQDKVLGDFESGSSGWNLTGSNMPASIVDNPNPSGINTSSKVLKVKSLSNWSEDLNYNGGASFNFYTNPVLSFKVYVTDTIELSGRIDNSANWQQYLMFNEFPLNGGHTWSITGSDVGTWIEIKIDLGYWDNISNYDVVKLMTANNSQIDSFYIDDVKFLERSPKFDKNTIVPIFYDPVTTIKWVGHWEGDPTSPDVGSAKSYPFHIWKDGFSMLSTDTMLLSPNGYMAWPNDTIKNSSGGAAYILTEAGTRSSSLTFPLIPTEGVGSMSLKFDMAVLGKAYAAGLAPKVEVKFAESENWTTLTLSNLPSADSTWTTVTADITGASTYTSIKFTNELAHGTDTMEFWIDDITLLGTTTPTESIAPDGADGLRVVSVGGTLQLKLNSSPSAAWDVATWTVNPADTSATGDTCLIVDANGLVTGMHPKDTVMVFVTTIDGTNIKDTVFIKVQADTINVTKINISASASELNQTTTFAKLTATVEPANATVKTVTWSVDNTELATINVEGRLSATTNANGTVTVTAKANDQSGITATKTFTITGFETSVDKAADKAVSVVPNPVANTFTITGAEVKTVQIVNVAGSLVKSVDDATEVSVDGLKAGAYFVRIIDTKGKVSIVKIVKQ